MIFVRLMYAVVLLSAQLCFSYERPDNVSPELWQDLSPYFLPEDHSAKRKLDKIFGKKTVTQSTKTVLDAGFFNADIGKYTKIIVSKHFDLRGCIVKMYLDSNIKVNEGERFKERIVGANAVSACIEQYGLGGLLKTPRKWIYPIPHFSDSGPAPKSFVLIAEDMNPWNKEKSLDLWKHKISKRHLHAVWTVLTEVGLPDCVYAFNIPFCQDGKLAFLDTEHCQLWPLQFHKMEKYLRGDKLDYWIQLTR